MSKKDFLKECMDSIEVKSTVEEFKTAFCNVCLNPECVRSQWSDSEWLARMNRQEMALNNPIFASDSDPRFAGIAAQNFIPVDKETREYYGGWVDVSEDGKVVHHANPPSETKSAKKVDDALAFLRRDQEGDRVDEEWSVPADESLLDPVETPEIEPEPSEELQTEPENTENESEPEVESDPKKPVDQSEKPQLESGGRRRRNTEVPQGGFLVNPDGTPLRGERPSQLLTKDDPWATPKERRKSGGKLTVRVSDGEVIKKE